MASDEIIDPYCDPCFKDGTAQQAFGYCSDCIEFYCKQCIDSHRRFSVTEHHNIQRGSNMPACQADKPVKFQLCESHAKENKDSYCFDHSMIICRLCSIEEHAECEIKPISEACEEFDLSADNKWLATDVGVLQNYAKMVKVSISEGLVDLDSQKQTVIETGRELYENIIKEVRTSFDNFCTDVTGTVNKKKSLLSEDKRDIEEIASDISDIRKTLDQSYRDKSSKPNRFIERQGKTEKVRSYEEKLHIYNISNMTIVCEFNQEMKPLVDSERHFGKLSVKAKYEPAYEIVHLPNRRQRQASIKLKHEPTITRRKSEARPSKLIQLDKISVNADNKTDSCQIFGLDITVDGNIILTTASFQPGVKGPKYMIRLISPVGRQLSYLELREKGESVAVFSNTGVVVSLGNKEIGIIDIITTARLSLKSTFELKQYVRGIAAYNTNNTKLIVTCGSLSGESRRVQMIDTKGQTYWETTTANDGTELFSQATFLAVKLGENPDLDEILISDWRKHKIAVLHAMSGKVLNIYDAKSYNPKGITLDEFGWVYVCYGSGEISVWSSDMTQKRRLLHGTDDIKYSHAIVYNKKTKELLVIYDSINIRCRNIIDRYTIS